MYEFKILSEISKSTFKTPHKFWNPYTEKICDLLTFIVCVIYDNCDVISLSEVVPSTRQSKSQLVRARRTFRAKGDLKRHELIACCGVIFKQQNYS